MVSFEDIRKLFLSRNVRDKKWLLVLLFSSKNYHHVRGIFRSWWKKSTKSFFFSWSFFICASHLAFQMAIGKIKWWFYHFIGEEIGEHCFPWRDSQESCMRDPMEGQKGWKEPLHACWMMIPPSSLASLAFCGLLLGCGILGLLIKNYPWLLLGPPFVSCPYCSLSLYVEKKSKGVDFSHRSSVTKSIRFPYI